MSLKIRKGCFGNPLLNDSLISPPPFSNLGGLSRGNPHIQQERQLGPTNTSKPSFNYNHSHTSKLFSSLSTHGCDDMHGFREH